MADEAVFDEAVFKGKLSQFRSLMDARFTVDYGTAMYGDPEVIKRVLAMAHHQEESRARSMTPLGMRTGKTVANEAKEKARTEMVDGSRIDWAGRYDATNTPDDLTHGEGSRVFPEWDPAKHVSPASLYGRGDTLSWVFCDEAEERARLRLRDFMSDAKAMSLVDALIAPEEPEGERLARFFATSAHDGHEAVRYERPVVPRPDDREWLLPDDNGRVVALFSRALCAVRGDWCAPMDHHWGSAVHSGWVYADDTHNPFLGVPDAIIDEVRGTLRSWTAMRAGQ